MKDGIKIKIKMNVKIKYLAKSGKINSPSYYGDCGYDVYSTSDIFLQPFSRIKHGLKICLEFDSSLMCMVQSKSGLAEKYGLFTIGNIIDSSYRGEIHIILVNTTDEIIRISKGKKIAQLIFLRCEVPEILIRDKLNMTLRDINGFGSTGT